MSSPTKKSYFSPAATSILAVLLIQGILIFSAQTFAVQNFDFTRIAGTYNLTAKSEFLKKTSHGELPGKAEVHFDPLATIKNMDGTFQKISINMSFGTGLKSRAEVLVPNQAGENLMSFKSHWISLSGYVPALQRGSSFSVSEDSDGDKTKVVLSLIDPDKLKITLSYSCCKWNLGVFGCGRCGKCRDRYVLQRQQPVQP